MEIPLDPPLMSKGSVGVGAISVQLRHVFFVKLHACFDIHHLITAQTIDEHGHLKFST